MKFCDEIDEKISLYIDGELDDSLKKEFEKHIIMCDECKQRYVTIKSNVKLCNEIAEEECPMDLNKLIFESINMNNITLSKTKKIFIAQKYMKYISLAAVACICMAIILTSIIILPRQNNFESQVSSMSDNNAKKSSVAAASDIQDKSSKFEISTVDATINISAGNYEEELNYIKNLISQGTLKSSISGSTSTTTANTTFDKINSSVLNVVLSKGELEILITNLSNRYNGNLEVIKNFKDDTTTGLIVIININRK